jgi:hypothetical protein
MSLGGEVNLSTKKQLAVSALAFAAALLTGCGSFDFSKVAKTINSGLEKNASCTRVPVGIPVDQSKVGTGGAIGLLKAKGLITEGTVKQHMFAREPKDVPGYVFTESGKGLVVQPGSLAGAPCIRTGKYEINKIEAVDSGNDIEGKPLAIVRATIKFVPEAWLADTKPHPDWAKFWADVHDTEGTQWIYRLIKSGDEFFYTGPGTKLK